MTLSGVSLGGGVPVLVFHIGLQTFPKMPSFSHNLALSYVLSTSWDVLCWKQLQVTLEIPLKSHHLKEVFVEIPSRIK